MRRPRAGVAGWLAVAAVVTAFDAWALAIGEPTLSSTYRTAYRDRPLLIGLATVYLVTHLTGHLPRRLDVLSRSVNPQVYKEH